MFVRVKKIKKGNYAYLVKNTWTKNGPRQKTKKYLGRCYVSEKTKEIDICKEIKDIEKFVHSNSLKKILGKIIEFELFRHGFSYEGETLKKDDVISYTKKLKIMNVEGNNIVIKMNEGYLCEFLLRKILKFQFKGEDSDAYGFADSFVAAGLDVDKEIFVEIYRKMTNQ